MGLAIASVKSIDGLAIASVKSIMGLDNTSGGGPDVYYWAGGLDDSGFTSGPTPSGYNMSNFAYGARVTPTLSGTCTKLAIRGATTSGTVTVKISLYDNGVNPARISSATADTVVVTTTPGWFEVTLATPVAVVGGTTYQIWWSSSATPLGVYYNTGGNGVSGAGLNAAFPPAAFTLPDTETGTLFGVKMYVD